MSLQGQLEGALEEKSSLEARISKAEAALKNTEEQVRNIPVLPDDLLTTVSSSSSLQLRPTCTLAKPL